MTAMILVIAAIFTLSACSSKMPDAGDADSITIKADDIEPVHTPTPRPVPSATPKPPDPISTPDVLYAFDDVPNAKEQLAGIADISSYETVDTGMGYIDKAPLIGSKFDGLIELRYYPNGLLAETAFSVAYNKEEDLPAIAAELKGYVKVLTDADVNEGRWTLAEELTFAKSSDTEPRELSAGSDNAFSLVLTYTEGRFRLAY
jgi:hypothetical protein